jgi:hypothetical protein
MGRPASTYGAQNNVVSVAFRPLANGTSVLGEALENVRSTGDLVAAIFTAGSRTGLRPSARRAAKMEHGIRAAVGHRV